MNKNIDLYNESMKYIPGGVNSPVRAFKSVGGIPFFVSKAKGSKLYDIEGNQYIDYVCSWGPLILGHSNSKIIKEVKTAIENGTSYGAPTEQEVKLAKKICEAIPSIKKIRLVNSGTEATMSAIRLARGFTGRKKIVKFEGCYHGHVDSLLVSAGSGSTTFGTPTSLGVMEEIIRNTLIAKFNDINYLKELIKKNYKEISAIIIEPIPGNMGLVLPKEGFLEEIKLLCLKYDILLIFDEVITGFRLLYGGAQNLYNITPDLTCLGKIIGGGFPIGAFGGREDIMDFLSPEGKVYQAGTLSGNPVAVTAGLATLSLLEKNKNIYQKLKTKTKYFCSEIVNLSEKYNLNLKVNQIGSMFTVFFNEKEVVDYETAKLSDTNKYSKFFHFLLNEGIYFPPSQFETCFVSSSHSTEDIEVSIEVISKALRALN